MSVKVVCCRGGGGGGGSITDQTRIVRIQKLNCQLLRYSML